MGLAHGDSRKIVLPVLSYAKPWLAILVYAADIAVDRLYITSGYPPFRA